jgi:hypothetical protein
LQQSSGVARFLKYSFSDDAVSDSLFINRDSISIIK